MPLQQTSGNVTQDAYGGGIPFVPTYVENVFSTYLYTGNGSTQTITNGINLAGKGGLIWIKSRNNSTYASSPNVLTDSVTGFSNYLISNSDVQQQNWASDAPSPSSTGFSLAENSNVPYTNYLTGNTYASWTFRKQPKFFDIVSYTGNGSVQNIAHNLGSLPGCIMIKDISNTNNWCVYSINLGSAVYLTLNNTDAQTTALNWNNTDPTTTQFTVGNVSTVNASGHNYIAYIFALGGTGGFGADGTQNIIKCGYFFDVPSVTVNLGWEPQWILTKSGTTTSDWYIFDVMRGQSQTLTNYLNPDNSNAESTLSTPAFIPTATGFTIPNAPFFSSGATAIYIAIRRGPMATPTTGASVFTPLAYTGTGPSQKETVSNLPDTVFHKAKANTSGWPWTDRLRGTQVPTQILFSNNTGAATGNVSYWIWSLWNNIINWSTTNSDDQTGNSSGESYVLYALSRAPGFYDTVCYTGNGVTTTQITHNLGVAPQLLIVKSINNATNWKVYSATVGNGYALNLNLNSTPGAGAWWNNTDPTSTTFNVNGGSADLNASGYTYVAYLFATCSGVSYVGSYTGTGATQSIACGFGSSGARFILAKRTDSASDWYVFDSSNGLTSSSSPYLTLDNTNTQTTGNNGTYASSGGFTLTSSSPVNTSGGTFIFLAIA